MKVFDCIYNNKYIDSNLESEHLSQLFMKNNNSNRERKVEQTVFQEEIYSKKSNILSFLLQDDYIDVSRPI